MTAYLSQTVMFGTMFAVMPRLTGNPLELGAAASAAVAVMVWLVTVGVCAGLERLGEPGPFEALLRTAVVSGERSRVMPAMPPTLGTRLGPSRSRCVCRRRPPWLTTRLPDATCSPGSDPQPTGRSKPSSE